MIRISITNFKNIIDTKTYRFSKGELIHLTGRSGAGKSTILWAFEWGLYGKLSGVKPRSKKELIPKISIITDQISIDRDGNDLTVITKKNIKLTSDAAQGHIFYIFGDNESWKSCSYLEQGFRNTLLTGSGEEKLKILRNLTYGYGICQEDDPDYYLGKIREHLKKTQIDKKTSYSIYESFYEETTKSLDKYNNSNNEWIDSEYEIDDLRKDIKTKFEEYKIITKHHSSQKIFINDLKNLRLRLSKIDISSFIEESEYISSMNDIESSLNKLNISIKDIKLFDKIKDFIPYKIDKNNELQDIIISKITYQKFKETLIRFGLSEKTTVNDLILISKSINDNSILKEFKVLDEVNDFINNIKEYKNECEIKIIKFEKQLNNRIFDKILYSELTSTISSHKKSIANFEKKKSYKCPSCKDLLFMNEKGNLDLLEYIDIDKIKEDLKRSENEAIEIMKIDTLISNIYELKNELNKSIQDIITAENQFDNNRHKEIINMNLKYTKISSSIEKNPDIIKELIRTFVDKPEIDDIILFQNGENIAKILGHHMEEFIINPSKFINNVSIKDIKNNISTLENKQISMKNIRDKQIKILSEKDFLEKEINSLESKIDPDIEEYDDKTEILEKELEKLRSLEIDWIRYIEMEEKMETLNKYSDEVDICNKNLKKYESLYDYIKKLSIEPIEKIIQCINLRLNEHLDKLFTEESIKVILSLFKQSSGSKRDSFTKILVNLQVYHGNNSYPNINSLSGGEADRVSLALTLTLAEISKTPIIFLDECMASLDSQLRETCLSLIKNITLSTGTTVVDICHESVEGYHDDIIKVSTLI